MLQIFSGVLLTLFFSPKWIGSFDRLINFIRCQQWSWIIQYFHSNNASLIFLLIYIHLFRGLFINRFSLSPMVWLVGVFLLLLRIIEAFLGYVLPWGQISLWGATVITNFIRALPLVGNTILILARSNYYIEGDRLTRFFSFHYILPFILLRLITCHVLFLHTRGSSNNLLLSLNSDKISVVPYFIIKDIFFFFIIINVFSLVMFLVPHILGDRENFIQGDYSKTPEKIQPEWYFLFSYAILRSFPEKLSGVIRMIISIMLFCFLRLSFFFQKKFITILNQLRFGIFIIVFLVLESEGANHASEDTVLRRQVFSFLYFYLFISL